MKPKLKTPEVYNPYKLFGLLTFVICLTISSANIRAAQMVEFTLTFANTSPQNGNYLTPIWVGFHNGSYDLFDGGMPASMALERIAEDGDAAPLMAAFAAASGTGHQQMVTSGVEPPVFAPGQSRTVTFNLDSRDPHNRFLSLASMIIPSNDAFIANDDPMKFRVFDDNGQFVLNNFSIAGMMVYDAGTEMNDEVPENTAFLAQAAPNTGVPENAMIMPHPGFTPGGTILSNPMFAGANFRMDGYSVLGVEAMSAPEPMMVEFSLTFANTAPDNGNYLTPIWVGFHNGSYDLFDGGMPASMALERIAEDGDAAPLMAAFAAASGTGHQQMVTSGVEPPVFAPGQSRTVTFNLDSRDPHNRFLSLASMIIPSNDAFIANDDPMKFRVFDDNGQFVLNNFSIAGMMVYDAGTEMNDEVPENTAFLAQAAPNTGVPENAMIMPHPGFTPGGTILSNPMFAGANFLMDGYSVLGVQSMSAPEPMMVEFTLTFANTAPENGNYLTPIWVGFHNGSYDLFDGGMPASMALERIAEDGDAAPLMAAFAAASGTGHQQMVTSGVEPPVFAPGQSRTVTFNLDSRDPHNRFLSLASMIIPSNDAFIANDDPMKFRVFDDNGQFVLNNFSIAGMMVYDAGTEMNDEVPENTAFLAQAAPNTGVPENAMIMPHPGFTPGGTILSNPMFAGANFRMDGYSVLDISWLENITISSIEVHDGQVILDWIGGLPPYQVQWREQIATGSWMDIGNLIDASEITIDISAPSGFFQVIPGRPLAPIE